LDDNDLLLLWICVGLLGIASLLHGQMIRRLQDDVKFAVAAASAIARETETS
jgi:hypothetical protein